MPSISSLIPEFRPWARELYWLAVYNNLRPRITSTRRSAAVQSKLYQRYLAGESAFPAAPPGSSAHQFGYAMDMVVQPMSALRDLGATWISWGGVWHPSDAIHFEFPGFSPPARTTSRAVKLLDTAASFLPAPVAAVYGVGQLATGRTDAALSTLFGPLGEYLFQKQR